VAPCGAGARSPGRGARGGGGGGRSLAPRPRRARGRIIGALEVAAAPPAARAQLLGPPNHARGVLAGGVAQHDPSLPGSRRGENASRATPLSAEPPRRRAHQADRRPPPRPLRRA
jgi:hypothetical protein